MQGKLAVVVIAVFGWIAAPVYADDEAALAWARAYVRATTVTASPGAVDELTTILTRSNASMAEQQERIARFVAGVMSSDEFMEGKARIYADMFTADELQRLAALVRDPVYQKLVSKRSEEARRVSELMARLFEKNARALYLSTQKDPQGK